MYVNGQAVFGAMYPTEIWHDVMAYALRNVAYSPFPSPDPALMPSVEYIDTPGLQRDDLISHGELPPPPTTTTTAPPVKAHGKSRGHGVRGNPGGRAVATTTEAPPPHVRVRPSGPAPPPATSGPSPGSLTATAATVSQATGASAPPTPEAPPGKAFGGPKPAAPPGKAFGRPTPAAPPGKAFGGP